jgi:hypothetical protein
MKRNKRPGRYDEKAALRWHEFRTMIFVGSRFNTQDKKRKTKRARALARR